MELIKLKVAAQRVNVQPITLLRAIKAGELEAVDLGRGYQVTEEALQKYIESRTLKIGGKSENANRAERLPD